MQLPQDYNTIYGDVQGEIVVGGVFLRLFVANPGWVLRKPKEFFLDVVERFVELCSFPAPPVSASKAASSHFLLSRPVVEKCETQILCSYLLLQSEELELVTTSIVVFLEAQPLMADQVPTFGHIPKLILLLKNNNENVVSSAIRIVHQLSKSSVRPRIFLP